VDSGIDGSVGEQPVIEHQAGELRKSELSAEQDLPETLPEGLPEESPEESIEHDNSNEWVDLELIRFEYLEGGSSNVIMYYELTNRYDLAIDLRDIEVFVNGEHIELWLFSPRLDGGLSRRSNFIFWAREAEISIGDNIVINALVVVDDINDEGRWVFEELEHVEFSFTVGEIYAPGSTVTNPEHMSGHGDMSLVITDISLENWAGEVTNRPEIEFVLINPTDYTVFFDETEVFLNGVQLDEDEFSGLFLSASPDSAGRGPLMFNGLYLELGDTITIRCRLQLFPGGIGDITEETAEFTFVL
jgi:hypothetical protein